MRLLTRTSVLAAVLLLPSPSLFAQAAADPSGHWEGAIHVPAIEQTPAREMRVEIDLAKNGKGEPAGTFSQPADNVKGLPLSSVVIEGRSVRLVLKAGSGGGTFNATLSADGQSMSGEFVTSEGGYSVPFNLTRTGDARIAPAPKSPPIGKELEGTWNGALDLGGKPMRIVVRMANQPDGTATGTIASPDGSGVEIAIAITQKATSVTLSAPSVGATYAGVLNVEGSELAGTWTQGGSSLPLTLRRAAK